MAQQVKDPALSLQRLGLLLWLMSEPCLGNFCMSQSQPKKQNKTKQKNTSSLQRLCGSASVSRCVTHLHQKLPRPTYEPGHLYVLSILVSVMVLCTPSG